MALATISNISKGSVVAAIAITANTLVSQDIKPLVNNIESANYAKVVIPETIMPFRIRITNIGIEGYSRTNVPGIGVQIIGYSNYIL